MVLQSKLIQLTNEFVQDRDNLRYQLRQETQRVVLLKSIKDNLVDKFTVLYNERNQNPQFKYYSIVQQ